MYASAGAMSRYLSTFGSVASFRQYCVTKSTFLTAVGACTWSHSLVRESCKCVTCRNAPTGRFKYWIHADILMTGPESCDRTSNVGTANKGEFTSVNLFTASSSINNCPGDLTDMWATTRTLVHLQEVYIISPRDVGNSYTDRSKQQK